MSKVQTLHGLARETHCESPGRLFYLWQWILDGKPAQGKGG